MAEEKPKEAAAAAAAPAKAPKGDKKSLVLIILVIVNMLAILGVGYMMWKSKQTPPTEIEQVIEGEKKEGHEEKHETAEIGKVIPLETFIVNLAGSKGRKVLKVNMELEVSGAEVTEEIDTRKAQIRDFIIIILSSKTYEEVSTKEGKDQLRNEIKDNINTFLTKGKVSSVYFTELIYN